MIYQKTMYYMQVISDFFGYSKYLKGISQNSDNICPMYLRLSQAERMLNKKDG